MTGMFAALAAVAALAFTNASGELYVGDRLLAGDDTVSYQALELTPVELTPSGGSVLARTSPKART